MTAKTLGSALATGERNRVLRNTYYLLALSMIPTAAGAFAGIALQFRMPMMWGLLLFLGVSFGAFWAIERNKNSGIGVGILLGWTGFMGLWLSQMLQAVLQLANGAQLITMAAVGTGAIFFSLATIATVTKKDFSFMGKFLFIGLVVLVLAALANMFFQVPALALTISAVSVLLFSAYVLYDVSQIVNGGETNYVTATLALYLDIYNIFVSLLNLLSFFTGSSRD
ncbi:Bax inhibitor-1/YccA family protein [Chitinibacteraceae bacterium HSL-7]